MKLFYSATEVKLMQMDFDLKLRTEELNAKYDGSKAKLELEAVLRDRDLQRERMTIDATRELNDYKLLAEKQRVVDKAECIVSIRKEYIQDIERLGKELATAQAQVAEKLAQIMGLTARVDNLNTQNKELLATVTELAKKPVIITKETQTATAVAGVTYIVKDGCAQPIVKV